MNNFYAGTSYNQVIKCSITTKGRKQTAFGAMHRTSVNSILHLMDYGKLAYATNKTIYITRDQQNAEVDELVKIYDHRKIIKISGERSTQKKCINYALDDGSIYSSSISKKNEKPVLALAGSKDNQYATFDENQCSSRYLLVGKSLPILFDTNSGKVTWKARQIHDELDLKVLNNDIDCKIISLGDMVVLGSDNLIRVYDNRNNKRRPCIDKQIQTAPKGFMTKLVVDDMSNTYLSDTKGSIYECDPRKQYAIVAKLKGITTTVTDMLIVNNLLMASSLDSYIRIFNRQSREMEEQIYFNKPIHTFCLAYQKDNLLWGENMKKSQNFEEEEVELNDESDNEAVKQTKETPKIKQIRKRNKVGLKYLKPREFDEPVKEEQQVDTSKWYDELNPADRIDFEQQ